MGGKYMRTGKTMKKKVYISIPISGKTFQK